MPNKIFACVAGRGGYNLKLKFPIKLKKSVCPCDRFVFGIALLCGLDERDAYSLIIAVRLWHKDIERGELAIELVDATPVYS